jgi:hypothetical protein
VHNGAAQYAQNLGKYGIYVTVQQVHVLNFRHSDSHKALADNRIGWHIVAAR